MSSPNGERKPIAALYVETEGSYFGLSHVDPWDEARDAGREAKSHIVRWLSSPITSAERLSNEYRESNQS